MENIKTKFDKKQESKKKIVGSLVRIAVMLLLNYKDFLLFFIIILNNLYANITCTKYNIYLMPVLF